MWSHISFPVLGKFHWNLNLKCVPELCSADVTKEWRRRPPRREYDELDASKPERLPMDSSHARVQAVADTLRLWAPRVHQLTEEERQAFQQHISFLDGILAAMALRSSLNAFGTHWGFKMNFLLQVVLWSGMLSNSNDLKARARYVASAQNPTHQHKHCAVLVLLTEMGALGPEDVSALSHYPKGQRRRTT